MSSMHGIRHKLRIIEQDLLAELARAREQLLASHGKLMQGMVGVLMTELIVPIDDKVCQAPAIYC